MLLTVEPIAGLYTVITKGYVGDKVVTEFINPGEDLNSYSVEEGKSYIGRVPKFDYITYIKYKIYT